MQSEKQKNFFSNKNYYMIFNILVKDIESKFQYTINDNDNIFKRELFRIMNLIFTEKSNKLPLIEMNKEVLKKTASKYLKIIKNNMKKKGPSPQSSLSYKREIDINNKKINYINTRPKSISNIENSRNIEKEYKQLSKKREEKKPIKKDFNKLFQNNKPEKLENINNLHNNITRERKNNDKDMQKYNNSLNTFDTEMKNQNNSKLPLINKNNNLDIVNNKNNSDIIIDGNLSQIDGRNMETSKFRKNIHNYDRGAILKYEMKKKNEEKQILNMETPIQERVENVINNLEFSKKETVHLLEISSLNRNWLNIPYLKEQEKENRFDFQVDFSPSLDSDIKIPIYENNPFTIKKSGNLISIENIVPDININSSEIVENPNYDKNQKKGNIIKYIYKKMYGSQNAFIMRRFRNVSEIQLINVTIPFEYKFNRKESDGTNIATIYSYPYILLDIEEFDGVYQSTNNIVNKCFCKLIPGGDIETESFSVNVHNKTSSRIKFLIMRPDTANHKLMFSQSPIASLNKLSIRLLSPTGENIGSSLSDNLNIPKDNFNVKSIELSEDKKNFIITTDKYFYPSLFIKDDIILVQELVLNKYIMEDCNTFQKFINRKTGHFLVEKGENNEGGYCNKLIILSDGKFDENNGIWKISECVENFSKIEPEHIITGKIINMSKQINLLFSIKTIENDTKKIVSKIV